MSGEEAMVRYHGVLKSMGDTYGFIKCRTTHQLYNRDVYITKSDLPDVWALSGPLSFQVVLNERGRPQAREVRAEENAPEDNSEDEPAPLQKAHSAPLPSVAKSPSVSSPTPSVPRSLELKPLSTPTAPWADIVDDDDIDFEMLEVSMHPEAEDKKEDDSDDSLGDWGRRRRTMSLDKPSFGVGSSPKVCAQESGEESGRSSGEPRGETPSAPEETSGEENGLLKRLLASEQVEQDEKTTQVRTPAVGLPLGAPPSAAGKAQRWGGGSSGDESEALLQDTADMGALSPGSDAIWRSHPDPFFQMEAPIIQPAQPAQPATAMQAMCEPVNENWPWQNWNSWTPCQQGQPEPGSQWQYNGWPGQEVWPQGETQWPVPVETWQREPGQEILKQLGVSPANVAQETAEGEGYFLPEALWNRTDVVRALCFKRSRRFLLGAESDLMRLLKAPEGALLRIPRLAPCYQRLLRELCKRFRTREESTPNGEFVVRTTNTSYAPLLPLAAFVPRTWGGSNPNDWEDRRRDPSSLRGKHNMTPCPGLLVPKGGAYDEFGPGAPSDDLGNLGGFGAHRWDMREQEEEQMRMTLVPKQWLLMEPPMVVQDDGSIVVTASLDVAHCGEGFSLALCEGASCQESLNRLLQGLHDEPRQMQRAARSANFHVLLVQPSPHGPSPTGEPRWCLKLGLGEQAVQGEHTDCRTVAWQDEEVTTASSGTRSATFWLATYAGASMGAFQGLDDGGMFVEAGIGRFPWGRIFRQRVQRSGVLRKVAVGALGRSLPTELSALSLESGVCPDLASREHVVKLFRKGKKGGERPPWWLQTGKHGLVALFDGLAICESAEAALRLQRTAEQCSDGAWQATTLAQAPIEEAAGGTTGLQRGPRARALLFLGRQSAIDLALDEWAAVAEASKKALLPEPPLSAPPPPPVPPPPPATQQPHWPQQTPPPPPPTLSRLSADAPVFTPSFTSFQSETIAAESKGSLSCNALPFIPGEAAAGMSAAASEFLPQDPEYTPEYQEFQEFAEYPPECAEEYPQEYAQEYPQEYPQEYAENWEEETWKAPENKSWNRKWSIDSYEESAPPPGWKGKGKGKNPKWSDLWGKGQGRRDYDRREDIKSWDVQWEDKGEGSWSEAWRSQWRGAEPKRPQKWTQDRPSARQPPLRKAPRPPVRQRKISDSDEADTQPEVISSASSHKEEPIRKGQGRGKGSSGAPRDKLRRLCQQEREAERAARKTQDEASSKPSVDVDKSALMRHLRMGRRG
ncbi:unnamed protein product [Effrenium voratum]|nr:unnamed protein product [Effrenium voratum]